MNWYARGLCRDPVYRPETWFPSNDADAMVAKRICLQCPVVAECRADALQRHEAHGVWGGLSEADRRRLLGSGTTMLEVRCIECREMFEVDSAATARLPKLCDSCRIGTEEARRMRNTELRRVQRAKSNPRISAEQLEEAVFAFEAFIDDAEREAGAL